MVGANCVLIEQFYEVVGQNAKDFPTWPDAKLLVLNYNKMKNEKNKNRKIVEIMYLQHYKSKSTILRFGRKSNACGWM